MSKTADLRKLIMSKLQTVQGGTYHKSAPKDAEYPYKTFTLTSVAFPNNPRDDFTLEVDSWDRPADGSQKTVEEIADQIEKLFSNANLPEPPIYPTFFREARYNLEDPDKSLQHIQQHFLVQLYDDEMEE